MNKVTPIALVLWASFLLGACSGESLSSEDEIKQFIEAGVEAAENRSSGDLAELIEKSYRDDKGYNKAQLTKIARLYFFRHKNIFLFTKLIEIEIVTENQALVSLYVAMAGSVISDTSVLTSLRAKTYRFDLELIKQDKWLLQKASWRPASVGDMQ